MGMNSTYFYDYEEDIMSKPEHPHHNALLFLISTVVPLGFLLNLVLIGLILLAKPLRRNPAFWLLIVVALTLAWQSFYIFNLTLYDLGKKSLLITPFCRFLTTTTVVSHVVFILTLCIFMVDRTFTTRKLHDNEDTISCMSSKVTVGVSAAVVTSVAVIYIVVTYLTGGGFVQFHNVEICVFTSSHSAVVNAIISIFIHTLPCITIAVTFIPVLIIQAKSKVRSTNQRDVALPTVLTSIAVLLTRLPITLFLFVYHVWYIHFNENIYFGLRFLDYCLYVLLPLIWIFFGPIRKILCKGSPGEDPASESSHLIMR